MEAHKTASHLRVSGRSPFKEDAVMKMDTMRGDGGTAGHKAPGGTGG